MLDSKFIIEKWVGQGGYSRVYDWSHPETNQNFAIKIVRKDKDIENERGVQIMREEHEKMQMLQGHPNILQSYGTVSNGKLVSDIGQIEVTYNILELAENGTFLRYIKETGGLGEHLVKFHFMQMWNAVAYIHSQGMAHLDIKLENILLDSYFNVKIADLGIAVDVSKTEGIYDGRRGTTWYMAPEINYLLPTETYDAYRADIYSLGMCLYVLVFGEFPVKEESDDSTFDDTETIGGITGLKWSFDWKNKWQQISLELQDLLGNMLSMEPEDRPSLQEILESKWILPAYDENMPLSIFVEMERRKELISEKDTSN
jgi:serine/threonine protein kinase